jgi:malate dehydrogenase (oxaloacetate-decarboxylating)(NADP+)
LIGATGSPSSFNEEVIRLMADINEQPVIFALSNPTSKSECTAQQAYQWSDGRAIFASGSKFPSVDYAGKVHQPGQGNNVYIFPGVGLGVLACNARLITDEMFMDAAEVLADFVNENDLQVGRVYPPLSQIRTISMQIAIAVVKRAYSQKLAEEPEPASIENMVANLMYDPAY